MPISLWHLKHVIVPIAISIIFCWTQGKLLNAFSRQLSTRLFSPLCIYMNIVIKIMVIVLTSAVISLGSESSAIRLLVNSGS
jgi:predicted PurR-regulated permease PerM